MLPKKQAFMEPCGDYLGRLSGRPEMARPDYRGVGAVISGRFAFVQIERLTT